MTLEPPAPQLRTWFTGTRPVVGSLVACAGLVLACSWSGLGIDGFGATTDVDGPDAVHLHGQTQQQPGTRPSMGVARKRGAHGKHVLRATRRGTARSAPAAAHARRVRTGTPSRGPLPAESAAPSAPSARQSTAKTPSSTSTTPPAPVTPPPLPEPPVSVPSVPVPTVTVPPPPSVQVPTVPTTTTLLGLP